MDYRAAAPASKQKIRRDPGASGEKGLESSAKRAWMGAGTGARTVRARAPKTQNMPPTPAVRRPGKATPEEFVFAAAHLEHDHILGMCEGLCGAGARLKLVYARDRSKVRAFRARLPQARAARTFDKILGDPMVRLVAAAGGPCDRGPTGCDVMAAGKDCFCDKSPFTAMAELRAVRAAAARTGRKFFVCYSERVHVECAGRAGDLVRGHYTLASDTEALIGLFVAHCPPAGLDSIEFRQMTRVQRGSGTFELPDRIAYVGDIHVGFYSKDSGQRWAAFTSALGGEFQNLNKPNKQNRRLPKACLLWGGNRALARSAVN